MGLGARPTEANGRIFCYADYSPSGTKVFRGEAWPCFAGSFGQLAADYGISSWLIDEDALYAVLHAPGVVEAPFRAGVRVTQTTDYPYEDVMRIQIAAERPTRLALNLRIPAWAGQKIHGLINGRPVGAATEPRPSPTSGLSDAAAGAPERRPPRDGRPDERQWCCSPTRPTTRR